VIVRCAGVRVTADFRSRQVYRPQRTVALLAGGLHIHITAAVIYTFNPPASTRIQGTVKQHGWYTGLMGRLLRLVQ